MSSDDDEADRLWDDTGEALKGIGLEVDQSKSCNTRQKKTEEDHRTHSFKEKIGKEATEWNSTAADEDDASLAQVRLGEAYEFPGHVEVITQLHFDARKRETPEGPGLRRESCELQANDTSGWDVGSKNKGHLREADGETTPRRRLDNHETADKPGRDGNPSSNLAAGGFM